MTHINADKDLLKVCFESFILGYFTLPPLEAFTDLQINFPQGHLT